MINRDTIINLAHAADLWLTSDERIAAVERFAALVAAAEREACAQIAEWEPCITCTPKRVAAAIRARSHT